MAGLMLWYACCVIAVESPPTEPVTVISELVGVARSTSCSPAVVIVSESRGSAQTIMIEATMPSASSSSRNQCCRQRPAASATPEAIGLKPGRTRRFLHASSVRGATSVSVVVALLIRSLPPTVVALLENILHHSTYQPAVPCFCALLAARQRSCVWLPVMSCRMLAPSADLPDSSYTTRHRRPPARGGPHRRSLQAAAGHPPGVALLYTRLHRRHDRRVSRRATPGGWPAWPSHGLK